MTFTWEINPATWLAIGASVIAIIRFWLKASDEAQRAMERAEEALKRADMAHESLIMLQGSFSAYREIQAKETVSRDVLIEVEARFMSAIDRLGDRIDALFKEIARPK